jgi:hypothetical protein
LLQATARRGLRNILRQLVYRSKVKSLNKAHGVNKAVEKHQEKKTDHFVGLD